MKLNVTKYDITSLSQPFWVYGLRMPKPTDDFTKEDWAEKIAMIILGDFEEIGKTKSTSDSEVGLGIPRSWYWFIARTELVFGNGTFLFDVRTTSYQATDGGACPFDTGGLWFGFIITDPPLANVDDIRKFFHQYKVDLNLWATTFKDYVGSNYVDYAAYVGGKPPDKGQGVPDIVKGPPNTTRAWAWEGWIERSLVNEKMTLVQFITTGEKNKHFLQWLYKYGKYNMKQKKYIQKWLKQNRMVAVLPKSAYELCVEILKSQYI